MGTDEAASVLTGHQVLHHLHFPGDTGEAGTSEHGPQRHQTSWDRCSSQVAPSGSAVRMVLDELPLYPKPARLWGSGVLHGGRRKAEHSQSQDSESPRDESFIAPVPDGMRWDVTGLPALVFTGSGHP